MSSWVSQVAICNPVVSTLSPFTRRAAQDHKRTLNTNIISLTSLFNTPSPHFPPPSFEGDSYSSPSV